MKLLDVGMKMAVLRDMLVAVVTSRMAVVARALADSDWEAVEAKELLDVGTKMAVLTDMLVAVVTS